ncbi:ParA family protein [Protofrankia symbiont of Coriaria ruscifolia]|uniref:Cobyrinic acid ac-diamide synthase n=1 Tax=Candidatus Protofrankia californiensis TaxID=1839754 RepID=A0A1C3PBW5_9ACTN|nr:ParA family protein [Protofrankia symbiont of Coriaria ruscifolia]SBW27296.1 Cobyrinic acid ac-diamide synthase [Candidatus Protofrankia californiensis]
MTITAVANQKGGVGKTATAVNVGGALAAGGGRVLLVDLDPQGHLTSALRLPAAQGATLAAALTGSWTGRPGQLVVTHSETAAGGRLDVVPTALEMFTVGRELDRMRAREQRLARLLAPLAPDYDRVLVDCPPSLDILTDNALTAANDLIVPVQAEDSSLHALRLLLGQVAAVDADLRDTPLRLLGVVVSLLRRPPSTLARTVLEHLQHQPDLPLLATVPLGVVVAEAWRSGVTVAEYAPGSEHAEIYRQLAVTITKDAG